MCLKVKKKLQVEVNEVKGGSLVKDERCACVSLLLGPVRVMLETRVRGERADGVGLLRC